MWILRFILIGLITITLMGCMSWRANDKKTETAEQAFYILEVERGEVAPAATDKPSLKLLPLRITSRFKGRDIIFRIDESHYEAQAEHQFVMSVEHMLSQQLQHWLEKSGLFSQVTTDESASTDLVLEAAVTAFYGEARPNFSPAAVLEMQFFLRAVSAEKNDVSFEFGLHVTSEVLELNPPEVVKGWRQALMKTLIALEVNLSDYFQK